MVSIRAYLLSVVAAAIISAGINRLIGSKSVYSGIVKLLTGLFLSITVVSPLAKITLTDINDYFLSLKVDATGVVDIGTDTAHNAMAEIIKENAEAYILDKAANFGVEIKVQIYLADSTPPTPKAVTITGSVAPYVKMQLQEIIENDLAISKENQSWT